MAGRSRGRPKRRVLPYLKAVFVLLVGVSSALMTVANGAPLATVAAVGAVGFVLGLVVVWITFPSSQSERSDGRSRDGGRGRSRR